MQIDSNFTYKISFSRRRTLSIIVSPGKGVVVRAPYRTPVKTIEKFVNEKSEWIKKSMRRFDMLTRIDTPAGYRDGDPVLLFGKEFKLKLRSSDIYGVRLGDNGTIEASFNKDDNPLTIKLLLEDWFKFVAKDKLTSLFREILVKYKEEGFQPSGFAVKKMRSRWGTCSSKGKIALSYDLVKLDEIYTEYVILHELCHLKHHNHGAGFYKLLSEVYPQWKTVREGLKKYIR